MSCRRLSIAICVVAAAVHPPTNACAQARVERRIALNKGGSVNGFVPAGNVRIVGWDRDSLVITGTVAAGEHLFVGGGPRGLKFAVEAATPDAESRAAHLVVHVPRTSQISMKCASAKIDATDASGTFYTVGGDIVIGGRVSEVEAEAMDGSVTMTAKAQWVRVRTASGALRLAGDIEDASTSSVTGAQLISASGIARGQFGSVTGDIVFAAPLLEGSVLSFDNHSGAVELRLASSAAGSFSITTISGTIENAFVAARPASGAADRAQAIAFRLGTGGSHVTIRTFKGAVRLRQR